jgi:hypothetical protein
MNYISSYLAWSARVSAWWANHPGYWLMMMIGLVISYVIVFLYSWFGWGKYFKRRK